MKIKLLSWWVLTALAAGLVSWTPEAFADVSSARPDLDDRIWNATQVLNQIMLSPDQSIPEELLAKCKAIAIYPSVLKGAFIFGARFGKGVVVTKDASGNWGPVAFSTVGGGSWGFQIGGSSTDLIVLVMNDAGMESLLRNNFTLGADAQVAAGPVGRDSQASTDLFLKASLFSYSRSMGLFAGVALDGTVLTQDNNSNSAYYGRPVTSKQILLENAATVQPTSRGLIDKLTEYSARWSARVAAKR